MFSAMCRIWTCRNVDVISCQYDPWATPSIPCRGKSASGINAIVDTNLPGPGPCAVALAITKNTTLTAIRPSVTIGDPWPNRPPKAVRARGAREAHSRTHSGHWKPTDAAVMQSGQMGRPQR